jgi:hypothetical protein
MGSSTAGGKLLQPAKATKKMTLMPVAQRNLCNNPVLFTVESGIALSYRASARTQGPGSQKIDEL